MHCRSGLCTCRCCDIPGELGQCPSSWCPGALIRQVNSHREIDYVCYFHPWRTISVICIIVLSRHGENAIVLKQFIKTAQIPQCIRQISHNAPLRNRNVHTCAHFCCKKVHCGMRYWCIVGFAQQVYLAHQQWSRVNAKVYVISNKTKHNET